MRYSTIRPTELSDEMIAKWRAIQNCDPSLANPYFCPEFTQAVSEVRSDVRIGLIEDGNEPVGFFPHQRRWSGTARPVGLALSDYHGVIGHPDADWNAVDLLDGCGLARWQFDHLPANQTQFSHAAVSHSDSPIVEFHSDFEGYVAGLDKAGRKQVRECERKRERLETEVGKTRYIEQCKDPQVLAQLMSWKSAKCQATGVIDFFAIHWCRELVERLHCLRSAHFSAQLSALYAGDVLVAVHLALRSEAIWHSWFPAYDHRFGAHSPGAVLLLDVLRSAANSGARHLDFGKDLSTYKRRYMTGAITLLQGHVEQPAMINRIEHWRSAVERWTKQSPIGRLARYPGRLLKRVERRSRYG